MLRVKKLDPAAKLPEVAHMGSDLGYDVFALEDIVLPYGVVTKVRTGIAAQAFAYIFNPADIFNNKHDSPLGLLIRDRSSMAAKGVVTSGGVIDAGYRGEISVLMTNWGNHAYEIENHAAGVRVKSDKELNQTHEGYLIEAGDKIAQMIPVHVLTEEVVEVEELGESVRGHNGFGSTGA